MPAGTVKLAIGEFLGPEEELRLLHLDSHRWLKAPMPEMSRRANGSEAFEGVAMPAGQIIAGVFDTRSKEYRWLSQPITVLAGKAVEVSSTPFGEGTTIVAVFDRPQVMRSHSQYDASVALRGQQGDERLPDVQVATAERIHAVFYDHYERVVSLRVRSPSVGAPSQDLALRPGKVESFRGFLRFLPSLHVHLNTPSELVIPMGTQVAARTFPERLPIAEKPLGPTLSTTFIHLPAEPIEVVVEVPPWRFLGRTDLSDWQNGEIEIQAETIHLSGTVFRGQEPIQAEITFHLQDDDPDFQLRTESDSEGHYETVLYGPPAIALVKPADEPERKPHWELLIKTDFPDPSRLDFLIPDNRISIHTTDLRSGEPVEGTVVRYRNLHLDGTEKVGKYHGKVITDESGSALLPALRNGSLELHLRADSYKDAEIDDVAIGMLRDERTLEIALEPEDASSISMTFLGPDGTPAEGSQIMVPDESGERTLWTAQADSKGRVAVPERYVGSRLLARFHRAGFLVDRVPSGERALTFPATRSPIRARVLFNGDPSPWARIAIEIQGIIVSGPSLRWLTGASTADDAGIWQARGLPKLPISLVAWQPRQDENRDAVALIASFGRSLGPSWAGNLELDAVQ
ncbi:MAG: carboxypeptidase-like regulatory domain-containing protein [Acidobacteriota bacterium]